MVANRSEPSARPAGDASKAPPAAEPAPKAAEASVTAAGGMKAWLPLIAALVLMPVLAYAMTTMVLLPKLTQAVGKPAVEGAAPAGEKNDKKHGAEGSHASKKVLVQIKKILVNVSGTQGMRFLLASLTLVGTEEELKTKVEENLDQLTDLACGTLSAKTISDLEKPGARNLIRTELISVFNNVLGNNAVQELYFTEFAIQ